MKRFGALLLAAFLVSCAGQTPIATGPSVAAAEAAKLAELRQQFGIPDCPETDPAAEAVADGLPRTALPCLGSQRVVNLAGLPRRAMVINFWAQWCPPCREESGFLREVSQRSGVDFLGVNYNDPKPDWALEFASLVGWEYPHVQDEEKQLAQSMAVPGLPVTLLVAADGRIVHRIVGGVTSAEQLETLIKEQL